MSDNNQLPFGKNNYILMLIGLGILILGMILMSLDNEEFGFGFLGLTLGPVIVLIGFAFQFYAILKKPKSDK
ncbi:MAG: DUF3098 domain-containing protein [Cytophagales bacterium]|nr:DUF3098 domain-containing protein [Hyphobacterium sp. CCMP332]